MRVARCVIDAEQEGAIDSAAQSGKGMNGAKRRERGCSSLVKQRGTTPPPTDIKVPGERKYPGFPAVGERNEMTLEGDIGFHYNELLFCQGSESIEARSAPHRNVPQAQEAQ